MDNKKKILFWGDVPLCSTGFAQVSKNILKRLYNTGLYEIDIIGINYGGEPIPKEFYDKYTIYPAIAALSNDSRYKNMYGFQRFLDMAGSGKYDIIFIINDTYVVNIIMPQLLETQKKLPKDKKFSTIYYFPVDSPLKKEMITNVVDKFDFPVVYTKYGKNECMKYLPSLESLPVIYHGVDQKDFFLLPPEEIADFKKKFFGSHSEKYVVLNVARNQPRKDLHKTFAAFKIFHDKYPNTVLLLVTQAEDVGGNLIEIAEQYHLTWDKDWICPKPGTYGANQGYPIEIINKIYNASDVVISSTQGEGWGLSTSEGMATMTPILMPKNTSLVEIIGENEERGYFCKSGTNLNLWSCLGPGDNNNVRPIIDVYDMAAKLEYIYLHPEEVKEKTKRAYSEVWTWDSVCEQWKEIFAKAAKKTEIMRSDIKQERNALCLCGSGKKSKNCCSA